MDDEYKITPQAYLALCRGQMLEGTKQGLFYAAFELRCCVEARLAEYFEHYKLLAKGKFEPYLVSKNQKTVNRMMAGDTIIQVTFDFDGGPSIKQFYTPVPFKLQNFIKNGVDYLRHTQSHYRKLDDPWWDDTRSKLIDAYRASWITCRGEMPLPILWNTGSDQIHTAQPPWETATRRTHPVIIYHTNENKAVLEQLAGMTDKKMSVTVEHLELPPPNWICDL